MKEYNLMKMLEREVVDLKARVEWLEAQMSQLTGQVPNEVSSVSNEPLGHEELMAWLAAEGLIREPTPYEKQLAAEWEALPTDEKKAIRWELDHLPPGPMVSDIIIENRS